MGYQGELRTSAELGSGKGNSLCWKGYSGVIDNGKSGDCIANGILLEAGVWDAGFCVKPAMTPERPRPCR